MKLLLHPKVQQQLQSLAKQLAGTYLWYGPEHVGKFTAACWLVRKINCSSGGDDNCNTCRQIDSGNFPDLIVLRAEDRDSIGIEQVRKIMSELGLRPYHADTTRFVIIEQADILTTEAQNALLKVMEEPPPATCFILLAVDQEALLPTVRSRCQIMHIMSPPGESLARALIAEQGLTDSQAQTQVSLACGLPGLALVLSRDEQTAEIWQKEMELAKEVIISPIFKRLVIVRKMYDNKADLTGFGQQVIRHIREQARKDEPCRPEQLEAVVKYLKRLRAGVNPRTALEGLMLEL